MARRTRSRNRHPRTWTRSIYRLAKGIRDGTQVPAVALGNIGSIADMLRRRRGDGTVEPYDQNWLWPVYAPFHPIRVRWRELQERGELTAELTEELQGEMYEVAYALLGDSRSHRQQRALAMYEKGRVRGDRAEAVGMSNFIIGMSSGRLTPPPQSGTPVIVSTVEKEPPTDLGV
jgi:hypothetical protein